MGGFPLIFLVLCLISGCLAFSDVETKLHHHPDHKDDDSIRLPANVWPLRYRVRLIPFLIPFNFTIRGRVEIELRCMRAGDSIRLHALEMDIDYDGASLVDHDDHSVSIPIVRHELRPSLEMYVLHLDQDLVEGKHYLLTIPFTARLNDGLRGFYRSSYTNAAGEEEYIAVTQFESTHARKAFPCFDEPAIKARFEISLGRTRDMSSISNMPIKVGQKGVPMEDNDEYVWDHFEESVPMSTYLVAFVVSKFGHKVSDVLDNNVTFTIWARENALDQVAYADSIGARILKYFEEYFNVQYPLPKQDMIAIPDFSAGAMENWGLITYRETALLYKPGVSSNWNKQRVAVVISHELAHQWFGNLVTMSWWDDLWLNEGFASYVEYLGVEAVEPNMRLLDQFVTTDMQPVMRLDCLESSHPVSAKVEHPHEIAEIFDSISYSKGAAIIRMMNHFLTEKTFRQGITNYLTEMQYKAASQDDLWRFLTEQGHRDGMLDSGITVKEIMDTWTLQKGYPVVNLIRNYETGTWEYSQEKFTLGSEVDESAQWWIPLTEMWIGQSDDSEVAPTYSGDKWLRPFDDKKRNVQYCCKADMGSTPLLVNYQQTGYYRVNYDPLNWSLLGSALHSNLSSVHVINRAQIVDDVMNLARAGKVDYGVALGIVTYLRKEADRVPWQAGRSALNYIDKMLAKTPAFGSFRSFMTTMVRSLFIRYNLHPTAPRSGQDNDFDDGEGKSLNHMEEFLRAEIHALACKYRMVECCDRATREFTSWMTEPEKENPIAVGFRRVNYCTAVSLGGEREWSFVWKRFKAVNVASERANLLRALSCTKETWLLNKLLLLSITAESGIRKQDVRSVFSGVARNGVGQDLVFDFARNHWEQITEYMGAASVQLLGSIAGNRNTPLELLELKDFRSNFEFRGSTKRLDRAIEETELNIIWMDRHYVRIFEWFTEEEKRANRI